MRREAIVIVDAGTTSMRAIVFDARGQAHSVCQRENPPVYHPDGRVEQDAATWRRVLPQILAGAVRGAAEAGFVPTCLAVTASRSSVIPLDREGEALFPAIMWQDTRTAAMCAAMASESPAVYRRAGLKISPVFSAVKMRWLHEEMPDLFGRTWKMAGIQDYLLFLLTGRLVTDRCLASRTNLFNLRSLEWDEELLALFGLERGMLCDLVDQGSAVGSLTATMAQATGLPAGIPVITAGGDQQCAALGLGLTGPGRIVANTGTGSYIIGHSGECVLDPGMRVICNVSAMPGSYILEAGMLTTGTIYRWFAETFYDRIPAPEGSPALADHGAAGQGSGQTAFERVNAEAAASPAGARGLVLLPHFKGAGAPHWNPASRGVFLNLSLGTTRGDMARAVLEGIAAEMADNIGLLESMSTKIDSVRVAGGLSRSELFNSIQASMYGRKVVRPAQTESTALGAWVSAAVCLGLYPGHEEALAAAEAATIEAGGSSHSFEPVETDTRIYARLRERQLRLYEALEREGLFSTE